MNSVLRRILAFILPALPVGFVVLCSWILYWNGDAVLYQFVYQDETVYFTWEPIRGIESLWRSITRHYMEVNGRFVCHFIVMTVASFVPQWLFAILNGVVLATLLWMVCRLARVGMDSWRGVLSVILMGWLAFDNLTDPAFYINYVWMGTVVLGWIMMFLRNPDVRNRWTLFGMGLFSLIAGQGHECFALPVGFALIVYLFRKRFEVSRFEWVAGVCFCVGGASTFLAPGMFVRIDNTLDIGVSHIPRYDYFLESILPLLFGLVLVQRRVVLKDFFRKRGNNFLLWVVIGNMMLLLATLGIYGTRAFTIGSAAIIVLVIRLRKDHSLSPLSLVFFAGMAVWLVWVRCHYTFGITAKYKYVEEVYVKEHPDTIWVPDGLYLYESRFCNNLEEHVARRHHKAVGDISRSEPKIFRALPASLREVPRDFRGNICRRLGKDLYLLVQSKEHPARFVSHKTLFPGILNLRIIPDRELVFGDNKDEFDIFVDSTATWRAAFYSLEYIPYGDFVITME